MRRLLPFALAVAAAAPALAEPPRHEIERAAIEAERRATELRRDADVADTKARKARYTAIVLTRRIQEGEARATAIESRLAILERRLAGQRMRLAERHGEVSRLLAALETLSRRPVALAMFEPRSMLATARVSALLDSVRPMLKARTADLSAEIAATQRMRDRLRAARIQLAEVERRLGANVEALDELQAGARAKRDKLDARADAERVEARALASRAIDLRGLARAVERDARKRNAGSGMLVVANSAGDYRVPASGTVKTRFGSISNTGIRARGLTLVTRQQAQVSAPAGGRVAYAGPFRDYGDIVIIEHAGERVSLLSGMERVDVVVGETVSAGSPLGRMGSDMTELYLELREDGRPADPLRAIGERG